MMDVGRGKAEWLSREPFTDAERDYLARLFKAAPLRPRWKNCYENALKLAWAALKMPVEGMLVEYGEGLGWSRFGDIPHAVMVLNGKAVDVTWRPIGRRSGLLERAVWCQEQHRYFMCRVSVREASASYLATRWWSMGIAEPRTEYS